MEIKVLGTGCAKCKKLESLTREVVAEQRLTATVVKEEDIMKIMEYGVMSTPGLVVNGKVVSSGRIPSKSEIQKFLSI